MESPYTEIEFTQTINKESVANTSMIATSFNKNLTFDRAPFVDHLDNVNEKKALLEFRQLMESVGKSPDDLWNLSIIPVSDDERTRISAKEVMDDDILKKNVSIDTYNNSEYKNWFTKYNFDPSVLSEQVDLDNLDLIMTSHGNLESLLYRYKIDDDFNPTKVTLRKVLECVRLCSVGEYYLKHVQENALETMKSFAPDISPEKPIEIIFDPKQEARGRYLGMYKDRHFLAMSTSLYKNPYLNFDNKFSDSLVEDESSLLHEMVHAKQSEIFGDISLGMLNKNFDELLSVKNPKDNDEIYIEMINISQNQDSLDTSKNGKLITSLFEGEAALVQLKVCQDQKLHSPDPDTRKSIEKMETSLMNRLRYRDVDGSKFDDCDKQRMAIYRNGYDIISPLKREFGISNLFQILSNIDINRLSLIKEGSPEIQSILADPRLLPGLEKNAYISQSLKINPPKKVLG